MRAFLDSGDNYNVSLIRARCKYARPTTLTRFHIRARCKYAHPTTLTRFQTLSSFKVSAGAQGKK
jgi:hypothetical protein